MIFNPVRSGEIEVRFGDIGMRLNETGRSGEIEVRLGEIGVRVG